MPQTDATPTLLPNPPLPPAARGSKQNAALHTHSKKELLFVAYATACARPASSWYPQQPHQRSSGVHLHAQYPPPNCEDQARIQENLGPGTTTPQAAIDSQCVRTTSAITY
jgi:hypothetical protein